MTDTPEKGRWGTAWIATAITIAAAAVGIALVALALTISQGNSASSARLSNARLTQEVASLKSANERLTKQVDGLTTASTNLGICQDTEYDTVGGLTSVSIMSPTRSKGGTISCPYGTFTPVAPQSR